MYAFIRIGDLLVKAYDHDKDWQVLTNDGQEYWYSVWENDKKHSLYTAFAKTCQRCKVAFDLDQVHFNN